MPARALARINLAAIERNCARLVGTLRPGAELCAVVKADGYGHGAVPAARAALAGGATTLAVAASGEAAALRAAGIDAPLLVLGALDAAEVDAALDIGAEITAWDPGFVAALAARARPARVHVKLDTGMGRLGTRDLAQAGAVARAIAAAPELELAGAWTHFATADEPGDAFFGEQLARFADWVTALRAEHPGIRAHAANSAATLRDRAAHFDLVRCGIAIYGLDPASAGPAPLGLEPALELQSYVAAVKACAAGESAGYGRRFVAREATTLATLPIGYADGVPRALTNVADVLIGGRRQRIAGTVSMDNMTVDLGPETDTAIGDPAILIGAAGDQRIGAEEVARHAGTISYELVCDLAGPRVVRIYHRDGVPA